MVQCKCVCIFKTLVLNPLTYCPAPIFFQKSCISSIPKTGLQKLWNPAIVDWRLLRKFRGHGKEGKHQPDELKHSIYDSKSCIRDSKHSTRLLKTLFFIAFIATVEKSYMLDPGSALDWRTLSDLQRPDQRYNNLCSIGG